MDEQANKQAMQELMKKNFRGHDVLLSKYKPVFPAGLEREYTRISSRYMRLLKETIEEELQPLKEQIMRERGTLRTDSILDIERIMHEIFQKITVRFSEKEKSYGLREKLERLGSLTKKLTIKEWKKTVQKTLGINIFEDYYNGNMFRKSIDRWIDENVNLIKTIPQDSLGEMKKAIREGFESGGSTTAIMKEIQHQYNISRSHAKFIACDQIGKLNAQITKVQQTDAGIEEYIWCDCGDGRVRKGHKDLNGKRFRWDDPPVVDIKKGRRCHPGEDYRCRCRAKPLFKFGVFNAPVESAAERRRKVNA